MRVFAAVLLLGAAAQAASWWDAEWTIRKKITIDTGSTGGNISEPIGGATVLLRFHDANFQFGVAKEDGSDIRFVSEDDKTVLPHSVEKYDALMNEAFVWVKLPEVKPGAQTSFWLYYGNAGPKATRSDDAKGAYDAETLLAYRFAERGAPPSDATGNGNTAETPGVAVEGSLIGGGTRLTGLKPITLPASPALGFRAGTALTWSLWVKPASLDANATVFSRRDGQSAFVVGLDSGVPFVEINGQRAPAAGPLAVNSWHHLAVIVNGARTTLHVDGEQAAELAAPIPSLTTASFLGGNTEAGDAAAFAGEVDELEISSVARPIGFVKLAAFGQGTSDKAQKLVTFGNDEQTHSWFGDGHFAVIIRNLTFDGWLVIIILGVMFVISWILMVTKIGYLNAMSKGNAMFMRAWKELSSDLTALEHGDADSVRTLGGRVKDKKAQRHLRQSSVYRIYHIGSEEIRHRLAASHGTPILSNRSITAIRAALDGGQVREKQRIDKLIVLLTICISGGPFLGLLGTVVGVMITFAAVAAAGEVNVNAIAPGIAAALLATVAGLAVAIPALFGYNYILSRVKDATADMHVFIDEFVTKMAEFYSEPEGIIQPGKLRGRPAHRELEPA